MSVSEHPVTKAPSEFTDLDQLCVNTIRTLAIDGVQKANSGHLAPEPFHKSCRSCGSAAGH